MPRLHLVELEDLPWFPAPLRDAGTDWLAFTLRVSGQARRLAPLFKTQLERAGTSEIVDLASGGGGPLPVIVDALAEAGVDAQVTMTDLFPNVGAFERVVERYPRFRYEREPVDATAVPAHLVGMRVMFNSFHHLPPDKARAVMADAARQRRSFVAFEVVERSPLAVLSILVGAAFSPLTMPLTNPRRWERWVFSWLVPVLPAFVLWDGFVSCMRVYSVDELHAMIKEVDSPGYTWEVTRVPLGGPAKATCLLGHPD